MDIGFAFETTIIGLLAFPWLLFLLDAILGLFRVNLSKESISSLYELSLVVHPAVLSPILGSIVVALSYFLGSVIRTPSDEFFDKPNFLLLNVPSDDEIKAKTYWKNMDEYMGVYHPAELRDDLTYLAELKSLYPKTKFKKIPWGAKAVLPGNIQAGGSDKIELLVDEGEFIESVKSIYNYQKYYVFTHSDVGSDRLFKIKDRLVVLRGLSLNGLLFAASSLLRMIAGKSWRAGVVFVICGASTAYFGASGVTGHETEYDKQVIGFYRGIRAAAPDLESPVHLWHDVSIGENTPEVVNALVEIAMGSTLKRELDPVSGSMILDRIVTYQGGYPINYGSLPQTLSGDLEPLDILVAGEAIPSGTHVAVEVLGVMKMKDGGEQDDKIIGRVFGSDTPETLSDRERKRLENWFQNYKGNVVFDGWGSEEEAKRNIVDSWQRWKRVSTLFQVESMNVAPDSFAVAHH